MGTWGGVPVNESGRTVISTASSRT